MSNKNQEKKREREIRLQYFSEQILSVKLLMVAIGGQKNNFNDGFKLESITT